MREIRVLHFTDTRVTEEGDRAHLLGPGGETILSMKKGTPHADLFRMACQCRVIAPVGGVPR